MTVEEVLRTVREKESYLSHWNAYKRIQRITVEPPEDRNLTVKTVVMGSSTLEPLGACLDIKLRLIGLYPASKVGGFNTYRQEALDKSSLVYNFKPDVIVLSIDPWSLLEKTFLQSFPRLDDNDRLSSQQKLVDDVVSIAETLNKNSSALVLVNNFLVPIFTPLGVIDNKQKIGLRDFFAGANSDLVDRFRKNKSVFVVDIDVVASEFGKSRIVDWNTYYRGSVQFSGDFILALADEYVRYVSALKGKVRKCIVLDLDNTLWGGIIGEDGLEGIKLGNTSPGLEYTEFQRILLSLYNRGIILAVNSKNNYEDAIEVLREHPYQILREEHFAAFRINWENKVTNMVELAEEINIGLDSMVFFDDNPIEREQIRQSLPEVHVVDLPDNPQQYKTTLERLRIFDVLSLTKEDIARGEMYVGKRKRTELERSESSIESFLYSLEIRVKIEQANEFTLPRIVQLLRKTNQFNLTTRRYSDSETRQLADSNVSLVYSMNVQDKFGDEGIVGVAIVRKDADTWIIDSYLMSCRVIGRSVETAFLSKIILDAHEDGAKRVIGEFIPTKKNKPAADFYERHGFKKLDVNENVTRWSLDLSVDTVETPDWTKILEG